MGHSSSVYVHVIMYTTQGICVGRGEPVNRSSPVGTQNNTEQPDLLSVLTDKGENGPNGLVGRDVMLAGRREMVDQPDLVVSQ